MTAPAQTVCPRPARSGGWSGAAGVRGVVETVMVVVGADSPPALKAVT